MQKNNRLIASIKFIVIFVSYGYIAYRLCAYNNLSEIVKPFDNGNSCYFLLLAVLLMLINWGIESVKWKYLVKKIENISFFTSFKAILTGITVSIFTPNRIGEFGGRIFVLNKENRIPAISSTIIGNLSQLIVTVLTGLIALAVFFNMQHTNQISHVYIYITVIISFILIYLFFNLAKVKNLLLRFRFFKKHEPLISVLSRYKSSELFYLLLLSSGRYVVFTFQFFLALQFFGVDINLYNALISIALTYLIMAIIPTAGITEVGTRGSVALFFIGMFSAQAAGIVSASLLLWIINLAIPAIIGSIFIIKIKVNKG
ncbi:MAG: flippase-like domain-containing protein [Bacteroidia bacterium]|nr:flippase-like domain-containing protein [Bacteroidia bacterium]